VVLVNISAELSQLMFKENIDFNNLKIATLNRATLICDLRVYKVFIESIVVETSKGAHLIEN